MDNGVKGNTGPQFSSAPLITSAVMVGAGTFFHLHWPGLGGSHLAVGDTAVGKGDGGASERAGEAEVLRKPEPRWPPVRPRGPETGARPRPATFRDLRPHE